MSNTVPMVKCWLGNEGEKMTAYCRYVPTEEFTHWQTMYRAAKISFGRSEYSLWVDESFVEKQEIFAPRGSFERVSEISIFLVSENELHKSISVYYPPEECGVFLANLEKFISKKGIICKETSGYFLKGDKQIHDYSRKIARIAALPPSEGTQ